MSGVVRLRPKQLEVEAIQIDRDTTPGPGEISPNEMSVAQAAGWMMGHGYRDFVVAKPTASRGACIVLSRSDDPLIVYPGDWIAFLEGNFERIESYRIADIFEVIPAVVSQGDSAPWEHEGHNPVQRRDGKPPWCEVCGWTSPTPETAAQQIRGGQSV